MLWFVLLLINVVAAAVNLMSQNFWVRILGFGNVVAAVINVLMIVGTL